MLKYGFAVASLATALTLALPIGASNASQAKDTFAARYAAMDLNGDGVVSVKEFGTVAEKILAAQRASGFSNLDKNRDGVISASELYHPAAFTRATTVAKVEKATSKSTSHLVPVITVEQILDDGTAK
ncbi:MAG TPA: hypothetical protein VKA19_06775 [Alphaproteobacteria bacterium]|nr:hypothetical protein [Alphaproteobacteria bacterium]